MAINLLKRPCRFFELVYDYVLSVLHWMNKLENLVNNRKTWLD